jgi:protein-tyrosine phosphatase
VIDLHSHVLPGVDDGARDLHEALDMLRLAAADGTRTICATPHAHGPSLDVPREKALAAHATLVAAVREAGIAVEVRLAAENWYRPDLDDLARTGRLETFSSAGHRFALVEFPPTHVPPEAEEVLFRLRLEGVTPVIAHPERNPSFWSSPERASRLREQGALLQVTASALTGAFRREAFDTARWLAKHDAIDLLASDAHRRDRRPPGLSAAAKVLAKWGGKAAAERAVEGVPAAMLTGAAAPGAP